MNWVNGYSGYEQIQGNNSQILELSNNDSPSHKKKENPADIYTIYGFQRSFFRTFIFHFISILLIGFPYLLLIWCPNLLVYKHKTCCLSSCDMVLVKSQGQPSTLIEITIIDKNIDLSTQLEHELNEIRVFSYQHVRYIWNLNMEKFIKLETPDINNSLYDILENTKGITESERNFYTELFGHNIISVPVKSYWSLFKTEILNPFYLFQLFSIVLWSFDDYYYYAACILFLSTISILSSLYETRTQSKTLRDLVENAIPSCVHIKQPDDTQIIEITPDKIVPGDILVLPSVSFVMPCDAILIAGTCIVNESMLTGESVPIMKTPPNPSEENLSFDAHKRHILFCGTNVQIRYYGTEKVLAKVLRTGFNTSKGNLIKSILYPQNIGFQFYKDSVKFITALFCIAILGMIYCVRIYMNRHEKVATILIRTLDLITIVVPPALPMAMTAGTIYSQSRLKKLGIYCLSPPRINVCGKMKLVCFDKTGTLTDDNLSMLGVLESKQNCFDLMKNPNLINSYTEFIQGMATCHSLTIINGNLSGDPLDLEIFKSVDWKLFEPGEEHTRFDSLAPTIVRPNNEDNNVTHIDTSIDSDVPYLIGIIKCYQFSSEQQCMSVITRVLGHKHMKVFTKGAPEKIKSLCRSETIPDDFNQTLRKYTALGYRVIGIGYRELSSKTKWREVDKMRRDDIERNLQFLGLIILQNNLKPETKSVIEDLHAANIRTVMITGDNLLTAISVARDCRMVLPDEEIVIIRQNSEFRNEQGIPRLFIELDNKNLRGHDERFNSNIVNVTPWKYRSAIDGITWSIITEFYPELIQQLLTRGTIFARFAPEQKRELIMFLQQLDYIVAMCGDGANDCSALRVAHIGISLSEAEASVAAPFTSKVPNISCVKLIALEGRCSLVTSFGIFKYMMLYSLIQFCTILILYSKCSLMGNIQFLYIDLVITASLAFTMGKQAPSNILVPKRPMSSLISLANVIPLLLQVIICASIQIMALIFLLNQKWYSPSLYEPVTSLCRSSKTEPKDNVLGWENTVIFLVSSFQYLILGLVYSKGKPYRQSIFTNYVFVTFLVFVTGFTIMLLIHPYKIIADFLEIQPYTNRIEENKFRLWLLLFPISHVIASFAIENLMADSIWFKKCLHFLIRKKKPKNKYKIIENELEQNTNWLNIIENRTEYYNIQISS